MPSFSLHHTLFLGFAPNSDFEEKMEQTNSHLVSLLTGGGDYLSEKKCENQRFLGKATPYLPTVQELENLEANVVSMLKKLVPGYPFEKHTLRLLAIPEEDDE